MALSGFTPPAYGELTCGPTSSRVALPAGATVVVSNLGPDPAVVALGNNSISVSGAGNGVALLPNQYLPLTTGANGFIAGISVGSGANSRSILASAGGTYDELSGFRGALAGRPRSGARGLRVLPPPVEFALPRRRSPCPKNRPSFAPGACRLHRRSRGRLGISGEYYSGP
jgi:hypothetical protein